MNILNRRCDRYQYEIDILQDKMRENEEKIKQNDRKRDQGNENAILYMENYNIQSRIKTLEEKYKKMKNCKLNLHLQSWKVNPQHSLSRK